MEDALAKDNRYVDKYSRSINGSISGAIIGFVLEWIRERSNRARLRFDDKLYFEPLEHSARVSIKVKHVGGKLPATNVMGQLTVEIRGAKLPDIAVGKENSRCKLGCLCRECGGKAYLAVGKAKIEDEALPWSLPIDAGTGLDGLKYNHLTHIPVDGSSKLRLFDIYKVKVYGPSAPNKPSEIKDEFWLVKVHSEYGVDFYPRICLKLPIKGKGDDSTEIHFIIKLTGENMKEEARDRVMVKMKDDKCIIKYHENEDPLNEYFKNKNIKPLELKPQPSSVIL